MKENSVDKHLLLEEWFPVKEHRHNTKPEKIPRFAETEVWWTAVGENVGVEINGKSKYYSRPVMVFRKLNHLSFMGIPLSTQRHQGSWYVNFEFQGKKICASLSQAKVFSAARLYNRLGQVAEDDVAMIRAGFRRLYLKE